MNVLFMNISFFKIYLHISIKSKLEKGILETISLPLVYLKLKAFLSKNSANILFPTLGWLNVIVIGELFSFIFFQLMKNI